MHFIAESPFQMSRIACASGSRSGPATRHSNLTWIWASMAAAFRDHRRQHSKHRVLCGCLLRGRLMDGASRWRHLSRRRGLVRRPEDGQGGGRRRVWRICRARLEIRAHRRAGRVSSWLSTFWNPWRRSSHGRPTQAWRGERTRRRRSLGLRLTAPCSPALPRCPAARLRPMRWCSAAWRARQPARRAAFASCSANTASRHVSAVGCRDEISAERDAEATAEVETAIAGATVCRATAGQQRAWPDGTVVAARLRGRAGPHRV